MPPLGLRNHSRNAMLAKRDPTGARAEFEVDSRPWLNRMRGRDWTEVLLDLEDLSIRVEMGIASPDTKVAVIRAASRRLEREGGLYR